DEGGVARRLDALGYAVHHPVERLLLPVIAVRRAVQHLLRPVGVDRELEGVGALGAECTFVDGAAGIAFDVDNLAAFDPDLLRAADGTVRTDTIDGSRAPQARVFGHGHGTEGLRDVAETPEQVPTFHAIFVGHATRP